MKMKAFRAPILGVLPLVVLAVVYQTVFQGTTLHTVVRDLLGGSNTQFPPFTAPLSPQNLAWQFGICICLAGLFVFRKRAAWITLILFCFILASALFSGKASALSSCLLFFASSLGLGDWILNRIDSKSKLIGIPRVTASVLIG